MDVLLEIIKSGLPKPLDFNHVLLSVRRKSKINNTNYEQSIVNKIKNN